MGDVGRSAGLYMVSVRSRTRAMSRPHLTICLMAKERWRMHMLV